MSVGSPVSTARRIRQAFIVGFGDGSDRHAVTGPVPRWRRISATCTSNGSGPAKNELSTRQYARKGNVSAGFASTLWPKGESTSRSWTVESQPRCTTLSHQGTGPAGVTLGSPTRSDCADSNSMTMSSVDDRYRRRISSSGTARLDSTNSFGVVRGSKPFNVDPSPDQIRRKVPSTQIPWRNTSATVRPSQREALANSSSVSEPTESRNRRRCPTTAARTVPGSNRSWKWPAWGTSGPCTKGSVMLTIVSRPCSSLPVGTVEPTGLAAPRESTSFRNQGSPPSRSGSNAAGSAAHAPVPISAKHAANRVTEVPIWDTRGAHFPWALEVRISAVRWFSDRTANAACERPGTADFVWRAPPAGLEPATSSLEVTCSVQLSYGRRRDSVSRGGSGPTWRRCRRRTRRRGRGSA